MTYLFIYLALLIFFSFLLIKATEILTVSLNRLSQISHISKFALTSTLLAIATSLPELFVSITAALEKEQNLALGTVLGSNIADISLVIGGAALFGRSISIVGDFLYKEIAFVFAAGLLPLILLIDGTLSRVDGLLLLLCFGLFNFSLYRKPKRSYSKGSSVGRLLRKLGSREADRHLAFVFLGAALLLFSADGLVKTAALIAQNLKLPLMLIGLLLIAIGTSLPELSFEIGAVRKRQVGMVFGDLLGSIVANSTLILGITSIIQPIVLGKGFKAYLSAVTSFFVIFLVFWYFVRTKRKLERWEGVILFILYFVFVFIEITAAKNNQTPVLQNPILP